MTKELETGKRPRVLLLDDDWGFCRHAEVLAARSHIPLVACPTLASALAAVKAERFDVIVLDYWFGGLTAVDLALLLEQRNVPLVVTSAHEVREDLEKDRDTRFQSFVPKAKGMAALLEEAVAQAGTGPAKTPVPRATAWRWLPWLVAFFALFALGRAHAPGFSEAPLIERTAPQSPAPPYRWDRAPLPPTTWRS